MSAPTPPPLPFRSPGPRRFAVGALERALGVHEPVDRHDASRAVQAATQLGMAPRAVYRLRQRGLTEEEADVLAVRAGLHPGEIWSDWWAS